MSRAFVKEDSGERWAPQAEATFRAYLLSEGHPLVREGDDLAALLRWLSQRERGEYEVQDAAGQRLALIG